MNGAPAGVRFTEEMKGFVGFAEEDYACGFDAGRRDDTPLVFHLTIDIPPSERFAADPRREAPASGWVGCDALGGRLPVERGIFNLFVDSGEPDVKNMLYRLHFADGVGHPLTLSGFKVIRAGTPLDVWPHTSTLYTRVVSGHVGPGEEDGAEVVASGILRIRKRDFARQLTTFRAAEPAELARFGRSFAATLWDSYGRRRGSRRQTGLAESTPRPYTSQRPPR